MLEIQQNGPVAPVEDQSGQAPRELKLEDSPGSGPTFPTLPTNSLDPILSLRKLEYIIAAIILKAKLLSLLHSVEGSSIV